MSNARIGYTYAILRYVHDIVAGEFINVGAVVFSARDAIVRVRIANNLFRVSLAFSQVNAVSLSKHLHAIKAAIDMAPVPSFKDLPSLLDSVLPSDASSLRWSEVGAGVAQNIDVAIDELFERFVSRSEAQYLFVEPTAFHKYRADALKALPDAANNADWVTVKKVPMRFHQ